ncbi:hypothetical protein [Actinomyces faecalis]|uniref:hypothetical protein n=1 Tax=Actinomyces faecalis TaxID=2722820 RepID=UPI001FD05EB1|nr:hypothetical protein [Actinomyces faecalis]
MLRKRLAPTIRVNVRPLTEAEWRRVLAMRAAFKDYRDQFTGTAIVARKPDTEPA